MAPFRKKPPAAVAIFHVLASLQFAKPLPHEDCSLSANARMIGHVWQRTARIFATCWCRLFMRHPLGWPLSEEVLVMMMFGVFQSRQISAWRAFFSAVGDLQAFVPSKPQKVVTGSCSSYWIRLPEDQRPKNPRARINWLFVHGGAFVAGDALMYTGTFYYYLRKLAALGVDCNVLSVEYPLAPEHPYPCALQAVAGAIEWLIRDSGENKEFVVGGDSAGGNLALAATALLRDEGRLTRLPVALILVSPAVDISDTSVFAKKDNVSSHIEHEEPAAAAAAGASGSGSSGRGSNSSGSSMAATAEVLPANGSSSQSNGYRLSNLKQRWSKLQELVKQQEPVKQQQQPSSTQQQLQQQPSSEKQQQQHASHPHTDHHSHLSDSRPGGTAGVSELLRLAAADAREAWATQRSPEAAAAAAARGWFDYLPGPTMVEEFHHYLRDPSLLTDPLVSPTYLTSFAGLSKAGMFITAGGAELMRPDIAAFAAKVEAAGVPVCYHEEPDQPHCWCLLALPHMLKKAGVLLEFVEQVACEEVCRTSAWRVALDE